MSSPSPPEDNPQQLQNAVEQNGPPSSVPVPQQEQLSAEQQQTYNNMMATLSKMNTKIQHAKKRIVHQSPIDSKKQKTDKMTDRLIQSKQSSEIITKENLLSDITESYEKAVIEVYSQNSKLKRKVAEMAKMIKDQNAKLYEHTHREKELLAENQKLRSQIATMKDERMMLARGHVPPQPTQREPKEERKKQAQTGQAQNEDFDFWSMPQNEYGKKKKDFVQDSNLWVNQKEHDAVFLTEQQPAVSRKKK